MIHTILLKNLFRSSTSWPLSATSTAKRRLNLTKKCIRTAWTKFIIPSNLINQLKPKWSANEDEFKD